MFGDIKQSCIFTADNISINSKNSFIAMETIMKESNQHTFFIQISCIIRQLLIHLQS